MQLTSPDGIKNTCTEENIIKELLSLDDKQILDLGCGDAKHSLSIASEGKGRTILALEVDKVQHEKNLQNPNTPPNLTFALGGAEAISVAADSTFHVVFLFKSLHHVPPELMSKAMEEVYRVLRPGGHAYISEPVSSQRGNSFMDMVQLFHDERRVQQLAFETVKACVERGQFHLVKEVFFNVPLHYASFADFERI